MKTIYNTKQRDYFLNLVFVFVIKPFFINLGREKAYQTSRNYYCEPGAITNKAIDQFETDVWVARDITNIVITIEKANKERQYHEYQAWLAEQERLRKLQASRYYYAGGRQLCSIDVKEYICMENNSFRGIYRNNYSSDMNQWAFKFGEGILTGQNTYYLNKYRYSGFNFGKAFGSIGSGYTVGSGIYSNIQKGSSWQKTTYDAGVDIGIEAGAIILNSMAFGAVGGPAGLLLGFALGLTFTFLMRDAPINGKSVADWTKGMIK
ncbi:MAG: hypothetical protein LBB10_01910 [Bifidobacteriaceae bacterium]|jgi:hypothetical protein|nr:hypothetical protein [Bifidobacteriaceae bacterium]